MRLLLEDLQASRPNAVCVVCWPQI